MADKKGYPGVLFYKDEMEMLVRRIPQKDIGYLFVCIYYFAFEGKEPEKMPKRLEFAWDFMKARQIMDREHYEEKCEKNAQNARRRANKERECNSQPHKPHLTDFGDENE